MPKKTFCILSLFLFCISCSPAQEFGARTLLPPQIDTGMTLMQALKARESSRDFLSRLLSEQQLSNLLWAANGINRQESGKRTAPSAMNRQEIDLYVVMQEGIYIYNAKTHILDTLRRGDFCAFTGVQGFVKTAPLNIVYVADEAKMGNMSDEDKKLYGALDAGFIAQNVYLSCASQGLSVVFRGMVDRAELSNVLNLQASQRIIGAQTVGYSQ